MKRSDLENAAAKFATAMHATENQVRKYGGEPYIVHPEAVANILREYYPDDEELLAAGWLHDVIEDTAVSINTIEAKFGYRVADLVEMVTNVSLDKSIPRVLRFQANTRHLDRATARGCSLKLADIIHNCSDLMTHNKKFAIDTYFPEKRIVLQSLGRGHAELHNKALEIITHEDTYL